jgi:hypothetical protein
MGALECWFVKADDFGDSQVCRVVGGPSVRQPEVLVPRAIGEDLPRENEPAERVTVKKRKAALPMAAVEVAPAEELRVTE